MIIHSDDIFKRADLIKEIISDMFVTERTIAKAQIHATLLLAETIAASHLYEATDPNKKYDPIFSELVDKCPCND